MRSWRGAPKRLERTILRERLAFPHHQEQVGGGGGVSYKEKLLGEIPGAYEQAFVFEYDMETEPESDDETSDSEVGIAAVNLSGDRKASI